MVVHSRQNSIMLLVHHHDGSLAGLILESQRNNLLNPLLALTMKECLLLLPQTLIKHNILKYAIFIYTLFSNYLRSFEDLFRPRLIQRINLNYFTYF